jgi:hypothetical protein
MQGRKNIAIVGTYYLGHLAKKFGTKEERKTQRSAIKLKVIKTTNLTG